jgi:MFS superfamily sulfate permease-like transporter
MAYASLAGVPPVNGLYSCFFASFLYMFFGTARHISIGTFAVVSMMVAAVKTRLINEGIIQTNSSEAVLPETEYTGPQFTTLEMTSALTFGVGCFMLLMGLLRLSFLTRYISDPLVSGFTTGSAVHVFMSQVGKALGIKTPPRSGNGMLFYMGYDILTSWAKVNIYTVGITLFGIVFLTIGRDYVNPWFRKRYRIPLPLELFLVIAAIVLSQVLDLNGVYDVKNC